MRRRDSLVIVACVALLGCALAVGAADGKKKSKGGGKLTVLTSQQHQAVDAGAISVKSKGQGGKVVVDGITTTGSVTLTSKKSVKAGKRTVNVPLSASGKSTIGGCSVTGLKARFTKGKSKKKKGKKSKSGAVTPLDRDEAVCSVGSENPTARPYYGPAIDTSTANRCDFLDPTVCLQPWPNDYYTVADAIHGHREASQPEREFHAGQHQRSSRGPDRHQPGGRLQPREPDHAEDPAGRHPGRRSTTAGLSRSPTWAGTRTRISRWS